MKENIVYSLVFIAVLVTAGLGLYFMFTGPEYGLSVEGVQALGAQRKPYTAWEESSWDLRDKILSIPPIQLPTAERSGSVCLVGVNLQTLAVVGYPVPRGARTVGSIEELENRGYRVLKTIPSSSERICPPPAELPELYVLLTERGLL